MMKLKFVFSIFILSIFGCDQPYEIEYTIENNTSNNIQIISSEEWSNSDTNNISAGTKLVLHYISGLGAKTEGKLESLNLIPLDTLAISNRNNIIYAKNALDIANWKKINPRYNGDPGEVLLSVEDNDFE